MQIPEDVRFLLEKLNDCGYSAYAVGGCVRDMLLGRIPNDWDLCTSALPEEIKYVFQGEHLVETGLKHGTLTVVLNHKPYEITTYRLDGSYPDHRHPDSVSFVDDVREDLSRRDFTVNAMACDLHGRILDLFGGQMDLDLKIIRCVGEAEKRFEEDALRVLRALRFSSVLDFCISPDTDLAIHTLYPTMEHVSAERIREELGKLLCGPGAGRILRDYPEVFSFLLPAIAPSVGYDQQNPHHLFTVWEHTIRALENVPPDPVLRWAMLLHDTGKPAARTTDENGIGHYKGHQRISAELAVETLRKLRFDRVTQERIVRLVEAHDIPLSTDRALLLRRLHRFGEADLRSLFQIHRADRIATGTRNPEHADNHLKELSGALDTLLKEKPCYMLKDLKVNGYDLSTLGLKGKEIGETLNDLLNRVMEGSVRNEKKALIAAVETRIKLCK